MPCVGARHLGVVAVVLHMTIAHYCPLVILGWPCCRHM